MRIVFIQFGDFLAGARHFEATGQETYHAQRYSMEIVERLAASEELSSVICVASPSNYAEIIESTGVSTYGMALYPPKRPPRYSRLFSLLDTLAPTHIVLRFPDAKIIDWCLNRDIRIFPSFADSFRYGEGVTSWRRNRSLKALAALLNDPRIDIVANHNLAASADLAGIGVDPAKIVPWDWPRSPTPDDFEPKQLSSGAAPKKLLYVGAIGAAKGVGDVIKAMADPELNQLASLTVIGSGDIEEMQALAREYGVDQKVTFPGRLPFREVTPAMHEHDALLVYTRHAYGEGLPGVIYQGLSARTPIIMSDHPVFTKYFSDEDAVIVPEKNPAALAQAIKALLSDPARYARLSETSAATFRKIALNTYWVDVVEHWLRGGAEDRSWLQARSLKQMQPTAGARAAEAVSA